MNLISLYIDVASAAASSAPNDEESLSNLFSLLNSLLKTLVSEGDEHAIELVINCILAIDNIAKGNIENPDTELESISKRITELGTGFCDTAITRMGRVALNV
ncbi:MAG: hypothetical protein GY847_18365 [Proteobacteria bacterium]|nr:hypothetical protein [Pseudomonadota bacterium]